MDSFLFFQIVKSVRREKTHAGNNGILKHLNYTLEADFQVKKAVMSELIKQQKEKQSENDKKTPIFFLTGLCRKCNWRI